MPYKLGSRRLALDVAWEYNDVQYPANWLRLSTAQDRAALGIIWEDASPTYNQKWYWGKDSDGNLIPKTYTDLKTLWIAKTKETANKLLQPSDWRVIKAKERGSTMNADWKTWRQAIRTECGTKVTAIEATADVGDTSPHADFGRVEALQQYIEGGSYNVWTADPDNASE
jgi:anti-sigma28 factor (negative regulator of flagellin synthesis)|tara:strand:- start:650 stop:1159 length:510 start_codon:yes stop_codon:yes gene_type:complete